MPYTALAFISVTVFALVHVYAGLARHLSFISQARFLSLGGGVAIAYVFIDLLPKLNKSSAIVLAAFQGVIPFAERHVFVMALLGFLLFFIVDRTTTKSGNQSIWLSLSSYALFNFLVGYAVVDPHDPEVQPLALFTFAMGLHYFTNDYSLSTAHGDQYNAIGKWILVTSLFLGFLVGVITTLPQAGVALMSAFIGGGVIMNVTRHELPRENPNSLGAFVLAACLYAVLLLVLRA